MDWSLLPNDTSSIQFITANSRQALALRDDFNRYQVALGERVWSALKIQSLESWLRDGWYGLPDSDVRLLSLAQTQHVWQQYLISKDQHRVLDAVSEGLKALALCERWQVDWGDDRWGDTDETRWLWEHGRGFLGELERQRWLAHWQVGADLVRRNWSVPLSELRLYGFFEIDPQLNSLLGLLQWQGVRWQLEPRGVRQTLPKVTACQNPLTEIRCAMQWARERVLGDVSPQRVAVVVPELQHQRDEVARIANEVLAPSTMDVLAREVSEGYNLSMGEPLSHHAMIAVALQALSLFFVAPEDKALSMMLRSPYLGGSSEEWGGRHELDQQLRGYLTDSLTWSLLGRLMSLCHANEYCREFVAQLFAAKTFADQQTKRHSYRAWSDVFRQLLNMLGWPTEVAQTHRRTLSSIEVQLESAWQGVLAQMAQLDLVSPVATAKQAYGALKQMVQETVFQPKTAEAPIQILGMLEAWGVPFDAVWICGLNDHVWPSPPKPTPFIPYGLQRSHLMPHADAGRELDYAKAALDGMVCDAQALHLSYALADGDQVLRASPLIAATAVEVSEPAETQARLMQKAQVMERQWESHGQPLEPDSGIRGGASALQHQALCPFRGYVRSRLVISNLDEADAGLDALERGKLVHRVLELMAPSLVGVQQQGRVDEQVIMTAVSRALDEVKSARPDVMSERVAVLESERLKRLVDQWLKEEAKRGPFQIEATESLLEAVLAGVTFKLRADRIDRLDEGGTVIVDYKTGAPSIAGWVGDRPTALQLPLYAVLSEPTPSALLFGQVKNGACKWLGLVDDAVAAEVGVGKPLLKAAKDFEGVTDWAGLVTSWRERLTALVEELKAGYAAITPLDSPSPCARCELKPCCRIAERLVFDGEDA